MRSVVKFPNCTTLTASSLKPSVCPICAEAAECQNVSNPAASFSVARPIEPAASTHDVIFVQAVLMSALLPFPLALPAYGDLRGTAQLHAPCAWRHLPWRTV